MFVDSVSSMEQFLQEVLDQVECSDPKRLYIDLEGIDLSRHGTISILTLLVGDSKIHPDRVYLVDVHTLGSSAFTTPVTNDTSKADPPKTLKYILESPTIRKVFFDVRNDSDALFSLYGVRMQGVTDLQLMENASRGGSKRYLHGLAKCIRVDSNLSWEERRNWENTKDQGRKLFAPELGGSYEVFNERPLKEDMKNYCEQDVLCMPELYDVYSQYLGSSFELKGKWYSKIQYMTESRIQDSTSVGYISHGRSKAIAPMWAAVPATMETGIEEELVKMRLKDTSDPAGIVVGIVKGV